MDSLENLRRKIGSAAELESVVRTMKAMAASNIGQYEMATLALDEYFHTVTLGIQAYFKQQHSYYSETDPVDPAKPVFAIVFGSDQGLVGAFNETLSAFTSDSLHKLQRNTEVWAVGERIKDSLTGSGWKVAKLFSIPNSVNAITPLIGQILGDIEYAQEKEGFSEFHIFHNRPGEGAGYEPVFQQLLPLNRAWKESRKNEKWPTKQLPVVVGGMHPALEALIREYIFVSIYRACAESMASENESRLAAMQRAEKNIDDLLDDLNNTYNRIRQSSIDEELFDVVSGFEALTASKKTH
ncbi:MAG: F0F1 ATP synthase subunit gamma [Chitinophagaceae bacterium]|nr:F0F1 ATP synthase subunit gamma [Chitinophagaceae bacterium]